MKSIRVQHFSTLEKVGGAARAANRLHKCLLESDDKEIFSSMRVARKFSNESEIIGPKRYFSSRVRSFLASQLNYFSKTEEEWIRSFSFIPSLIASEINRGNYDLIHLHWVQTEFISIEAIGKIKKPIIWTFHDAWPFCGSEHYPKLNNKRYSEGYLKSNRPSFEQGLDLDKWCWERKLKSLKNKKINIIAPTKWMAELARSSVLMKDQKITVIPNPLPTDIFKPYEKSYSRNFFNLQQNKKFILFGAVSGIKDPRKGWDLFIKALDYLSSEKYLEIIVLGESGFLPDKIKGFKLTQISNLNNDSSIAKLYSAADLVVVPSRSDNLPQLITEAQSCGTPVVTFNSTGLKECIENLETGFLANSLIPESLAVGIKWILESEVRYQRLSKNSRNFALRNWSYEVIYSKYKDYYSSIMNDCF